MKKIGLPILWWMDANDLKKVEDDGDKLIEIVAAVKEFDNREATPLKPKTIDELKVEIDEIINRASPSDN